MKKIMPIILISIAAMALSGCGYNVMQAKEEAVLAAWAHGRGGKVPESESEREF
jgi:hypothetical protein